MKTTSRIFSIVIICLISFYNSNVSIAQWIDHGDYKELKPLNYPISQIRTPKNEKLIYVVDTSGLYMIFDYNGNKVYEKNLKTIDSLNHYFTLSRDGKVQLTKKVWEAPDGYNKHSYNVIIVAKQITNDSTLEYIYNSGYASIDPPDPNSFDIEFLDYNLNKHMLLFKFSESVTSYAGGWGSYTYWGSSEDILDIDADYSHFLQTENSSHGSHDPSRNTGSSNSSFRYNSELQKKSYLIDTSYYNSENSSSKIDGYIPDNARLSYDTNMFIVEDYNTIYFYNFKKDNFYIADSLKFDSDSYHTEFSFDNKYLIMINSDERILFYNIASKLLIDSLVPADSFKTLSYNVLVDSTGLIVTDYKTIRYYKPKVFKDTLVAQFNIPKFLYSSTDTVCFTNTSLGNPEKFLWDFGDGEISHEKHPKHAYQYPGKYFVTLLIQKGDKILKLTSAKPIKVILKKTVDFITDKTSGDAPLTVQFTDISSRNNFKRIWSLGEDYDVYSSDKTIFHTYNLPGIYPVKLIVQDSISTDTLIKWDYIVVNQKPITDTSIKSENILWNLNEHIERITALSSNDGRSILEINFYKNKIIQILDKDFNIEWSKLFNYCSKGSYIKKNNFDEIYFSGDTINQNIFFCLNMINSNGEIKRVQNLEIKNKSVGYDFFPFDEGYYIFTNSDSIYNDKYLPDLKMQIYGHTDELLDSKILKNKSIYPYLQTGSITDFNFDFLNDKLIIYTGCLMYDLQYSNPNQFERFIFYINTKDVNNYITSGLSYNWVAKLLYLNYSNLISINNNGITKRKVPLVQNGYCYPNDLYYYNITFMNGKRLTDTTFIAVGTKGKHCWYGILDSSGKIIEEHEIKERLGALRSILLNKDGTFTLFGSVYKNSFNDRSIYSDTNQIGHIQAGVIILKTRQYLRTDSPDIKHDYQLSISPNPASDFIEISGINPMVKDGVDGSAIKIYDLFGQTVLAVNATYEFPFQINVSSLAPGMYFVRIGDRVGKFVKL